LEEVLVAAKAMGLALTYVDARLPDLSAGSRNWREAPMR
jgi:hypothetical protein